MSIQSLFDRYDRGQLNRRDLLIALGALGLGTRPMLGQSSTPTFQASGLNHIALAVTDVDRSRKFYEKHLGLSTTSQSSSTVFLDCGEQFVALFRSETPGLHHYAYSIPGYTQSSAAERLREAGLEPKLRGQRTYFDDPDGIEVQVSRA